MPGWALQGYLADEEVGLGVDQLGRLLQVVQRVRAVLAEEAVVDHPLPVRILGKQRLRNGACGVSPAVERTRHM